MERFGRGGPGMICGIWTELNRNLAAKHWADEFRTLHGMMTHGFPNQFFTGFIGTRVVEPSLKAQDEWVKTIRETGFDISQFQRECTPSYFNNEGDEKKARWFLGESYGPGWARHGTDAETLRS